MCDSAAQDFLAENAENSKEMSLFDVDTKDSGFSEDGTDYMDHSTSPLSLEDQEATIMCFSPRDHKTAGTPGKGCFYGKKKRLFVSPEFKSPCSQAANVLKRLRIFDSVKTEGEPPSHITFSGGAQSDPLGSPVALVPSLEVQKDIVKNAVEKSVNDEDLIGDFSKSYALPLVSGSHPDLKCISVETMKDVLEGKYDGVISSFRIVDSRYPYEFEGGHIKGALNLYTKDDYLKLLDEPAKPDSERHILIFHCEFSKERGPNMVRHLRKADRTKNSMAYPALNYPEMYVLEGGYKGFFHSYPEHCEPREYKQMLHPEHTDDMRFFRKKCKSLDEINTGKKSAKSRSVRKYLSQDYY